MAERILMAVKSEPDVILYRGNYPGGPWITAAGDRLLCAFRDDGVHGFSATGKILWMESLNAGQSWSASRVAVDDAGVDDRNAAIAELPDKTWMIVYNSYSREKVSRCWATTSQDQGENWSQPVSLAGLDARTRSAPIALASGDILVPIYRAPGNGSIAVRSSDGGKTWAAAAVPDVEGFVGDEWDVLEVERGRIAGLIRNNGSRDGFFWKTESSDGGRKPSPLFWFTTSEFFTKLLDTEEGQPTKPTSKLPRWLADPTTIARPIWFTPVDDEPQSLLHH